MLRHVLVFQLLGSKMQLEQKLLLLLSDLMSDPEELSYGGRIELLRHEASMSQQGIAICVVCRGKQCVYLLQEGEKAS